jgi:hypothetical protein
MTTIRELLVKLGVDADQKKLEQFDQALETVKSTAIGALKVVAGLAAGLTAMGAAATHSAEELAAEAKVIDQQAKLLGVTTDRYQELRYAVAGYGVEAGDLADVYAQIAGKAKDAEGGNKDAAKSFKDLGISVKELKGLSPDGLMRLLAERGGQAADHMSWLSTASKVFGEEGARQFGPLLKDGIKNFDGLAAKARELGLVMSTDALKAAQDYGIESRELKGTLTSLKQEITLALMPALGAGAKRTREWIQANRPWITGMITKGVDRFGKAVGKARDFLRLIGNGDAMGGIERIAKMFAAGLGVVATLKGLSFLMSFLTLIKATLGLISAAGAIAAVKIAAVVAVVTTLFLLFEDGLTYLRGGDSLLGRWITRAKEAGGTMGRLGKLVEAFGRFAKAAFAGVSRIVGALFKTWWRLASQVLGGMWELFKAGWEKVGQPLLDLILDLMIGFFDKSGQGWEKFVKYFDDGFGIIGSSAEAAVQFIESVFQRAFAFINSGFQAVLDKVADVIGKLRQLPGIRELLAEDTPTGAGDGSLLALTRRATGNAFADVRQRAGAAAGSIANSFGPTTYQITQQPGEDSVEFARRVEASRRADEAKKARLMRSRAGGER